MLMGMGRMIMGTIGEMMMVVFVTICGGKMHMGP
jgi:hypothetical protein